MPRGRRRPVRSPGSTARRSSGSPPSPRRIPRPAPRRRVRLLGGGRRRSIPSPGPTGSSAGTDGATSPIASITESGSPDDGTPASHASRLPSLAPAGRESIEWLDQGAGPLEQVGVLALGGLPVSRPTRRVAAAIRVPRSRRRRGRRRGRPRSVHGASSTNRLDAGGRRRSPRGRDARDRPRGPRLPAPRSPPDAPPTPARGGDSHRGAAACSSPRWRRGRRPEARPPARSRASRSGSGRVRGRRNRSNDSHGSSRPRW